MPTPLPLFPTPPATVLEALTRVRSLISEPSRWCRGTWGCYRHPSGATVRCADGLSPNLECLCLLGAFERAFNTPFPSRLTDPIALAALQALIPHIPSYNNPYLKTGMESDSYAIAYWQDSRDVTHALILRVLDAAITSLSPASAAL